MRITFLTLCIIFLLGSCSNNTTNAPSLEEGHLDFTKLDAPKITPQWLQQHIKADHPRLIYQKQELASLKEVISKNDLAKAYYNYLIQQANSILNKQPLERDQTGRRLLPIAREAMKRLGILSILYRIDKNEIYLHRVIKEVEALCNFSDWNPSHFLDVAEMAMGLSVTLDWLWDDLPNTTKVLIQDNLIQKALQPSFDGHDEWVSNTHNWNQVCHGGLIAAALMTAEKNSELAAKTIQRALEYIPYALSAYAPDGAYPEGPDYWLYGTTYSILTSAMLESALGNDFGLSESQGFLESALYRLMMVGPTGSDFNYGDNKDIGVNFMTQQALAWFALKANKGTYFQKNNFLNAIESTKKNEQNRLSGYAFPWVCKALKTPFGKEESLPEFYIGKGKNPVAVINLDDGFYLAAKGGKAAINHGCMDAGSFVFDWDGVRWVMDMGNSSYHYIEQEIGDELWSLKQESKRWSILMKNNFGHSTLTANDKLHQVEGLATLTSDGFNNDGFSINLTPVLSNYLDQANRHFTKVDKNTLEIRDEIISSAKTELIVWTMITQTQVEVKENGFSLKQEGKELQVEVLSPKGAQLKIISLDPPPLSYDKQIENLKRLEIVTMPSDFQNGEGEIKVQLKGVSL